MWLFIFFTNGLCMLMLLLLVLLSSTSLRLKGERLVDLAVEEEGVPSEGSTEEGEDVADIIVNLLQPLLCKVVRYAARQQQGS